MNYELTWLLRRQASEYHTMHDLATLLGRPSERLAADLDDLARHGFELDCHPVMGIRLAAVPPGIDRDEIAFARRGCRFGHAVRVYGTTTSTNDLALAVAAGGPRTEGTVIVAEEQTAGRGRQGARWLAARGQNLLLSIVHWAGPGSATPAPLILATSVAVAAAVEEVTGLATGIKWPNDVEVRRRKVCGILIEKGRTRFAPPAAPDARESGEAYVIGVGLNVNQDQFPAEIAGRATSLRLEAGALLDRTLMLERILNRLEISIALLDGGERDRLLEEYIARCDMLGRAVTVREGGKSFRGTVESISPDYALVLRLEGGNLRSFDALAVTLS